MNDFWSAKAKELTPYVPGEQPRVPGLIKLNTNENAYPPSPKVLEAVAAEAGSLRLYPPPDSPALREALGERLGLPADWVFVGNGSDEVLALAFLAYFNPGEGIAWPKHTYSFYPVYAKLFGMIPMPAPMGEALSVDVGALLAQGCPVALANPNAPTSRALPPDDVRFIADALLARGQALLLDEAYVAFGGESGVPLLADHPNVVIVGTFSKSYALAGMRVGYALAQPETLKALIAVKDSFNSYPLDRLAAAAGTAAVLDEEYYAKTRGMIVSTREWFAKELTTLGFEVLPSAANFVFARHPAHSGEALMARLRAHNILVRRFPHPDTADYLRITIGTDDDMIKVAEALAKINEEV